MTRISNCFSGLPPFHDNRYIEFKWPDDIQPNEAKFMEELFALQMKSIHRMAENNVRKKQGSAEYDSWYTGKGIK